MKVEKGGLPDPHGPLETVPSSSEFKLLGIESYLVVKKGGSYAKYTPEQKAKRAAKHSVVASYHRFYLKRIDLAFKPTLYPLALTA